jgi:adenylate cyclase class IV
VREELSTRIGEPEALAEILENLGYSVVLEIERHIWQYSLGQATIRFERYPLMDDLVEVEGPPEAIEKGIAALDMERASFNADRLTDFVARFEARTNKRAALSTRPPAP